MCHVRNGPFTSADALATAAHGITAPHEAHFEEDIRAEDNRYDLYNVRSAQKVPLRACYARRRAGAALARSWRGCGAISDEAT